MLSILYSVSSVLRILRMRHCAMLRTGMPPIWSQDFASASGIEVFSPVSHTLFDPAHIIRKVFSWSPVLPSLMAARGVGAPFPLGYLCSGVD